MNFKRPISLISLPFVFLMGACSGEDPGAEQGAGEPVVFEVTIENLSGSAETPTPIAPGIWLVHGKVMPLFEEGQMQRGVGLEQLAEDGSPDELLEALGQEWLAGSFDASGDGYDEAAAMPGQSFSFEIAASPGERLSLAAMFVESNDYFIGLSDSGSALFDETGAPFEGELEPNIWDAGTEVDQPLGEGEDQPLRQEGPNTGASEGEAVSLSELSAGDFVKISVKLAD